MGPRRSGYGGQRKPGGNNSGMAQGKGGPPSSQCVESDSMRIFYTYYSYRTFSAENGHIDKVLLPV